MAITDIMSQGQELSRRRKLVEAMQADAMTNSELAGSGKGNILNALGGWLGQRRSAEASQALSGDEAAYRGEYAKQLGEETNAYLDRSQGRAGDTMSEAQVGDLMQNDQAPQLQEPVKANPREAMIRAMTSQFPEMQALGKSQMSLLGKPQEIKQHVINGKLVEGVPGQTPRIAGDYSQVDEYGPMETLGTDAAGKPIQGQKNRRTGKYEYAPGGGQTINVGGPGDKELFAPALKVLESSREGILGAQKDLNTASRIYELAKDPQVISGFGADKLATISAVGAKLGFNGPEASAKTQALMTDLASTTLAKGQDMKGSFSDKDIEFLKQVSAGNIELNPDTMREVAALAYTAAHNTILNSSKQYSGAAGLTEQTQRASAMYPMPAINHKNLDPALFADDEATGLMRYNSPLTQPAASRAPTKGGAVNWREYLKGGQ